MNVMYPTAQVGRILCSTRRTVALWTAVAARAMIL